MKEAKKGAPLSPREIQVVRMVVDGIGVKTIARLMGIDFRTVATYKRRASQKLGFGYYSPTIVALAHRAAEYLSSLTASTGQPPSAGDCSPEASPPPAVSSQELT